MRHLLSVKARLPFDNWEKLAKTSANTKEIECRRNNDR